MGTCIVRIQCARVHSACTRRLLNLSAEANINSVTAHPRVIGATFLLKIKQISFFRSVSKGFIILKKHKNQFKMLLETSFLVEGIAQDKNVSMSIHGKKWWTLLRTYWRKAYCHILNIPLKDQKPTIILFDSEGTYCFVIETSWDNENEKSSTFSVIFFCQSQSNTAKPEPKKAKFNPFLVKSCRLPFGWFS